MISTGSTACSQCLATTNSAMTRHDGTGPHAFHQMKSAASAETDLHIGSVPRKAQHNGLLCVDVDSVVLKHAQHPHQQLNSGKPVADALPGSTAKWHILALLELGMLNGQIYVLLVVCQIGVG